MSVMLMNTRVLVTAIICGMVIVLSLVGGLVYLAASNADASTLLSLVSTMVALVNTIFLIGTRSAVNQLTQQTNGTQRTLIDAAIHSGPPANHIEPTSGGK